MNDHIVRFESFDVAVLNGALQDHVVHALKDLTQAHPLDVFVARHCGTGSSVRVSQNSFERQIYTTGLGSAKILPVVSSERQVSIRRLK